ncbi:DUF927 domain-containing protein [Herbaspirillum frisingense]|uniref:DUF927 domain-containing protein n=1 Tax=Herbaspirillum frisingense TaxID=92645 RepID=UPI001601184E|nr:DUF927 domain-containing protein [Herbaspirillum frisingense]QNB09251.1 DUF927 domain-containing protein [Herbaspirillum frisingense]
MSIDFSTLHPMGNVVIENGLISKQSPDTEALAIVTMGYFGVAAKLFSLNDRKIAYLVKVRSPGDAEDRDVIIPGQDIHNKTKIMSSLCAQGLIVQNDKLFYVAFKDSLALCSENGKSITLVNRTGWFADRLAYSTGSKIICKDNAISSNFILDQEVNQNMRTAGTLAQWREHVLTPCINNPFLLTAGMIALSSLTLDISGVGSKWVNWFGKHGKGKTTMLQVAASYFGNGVDPSHASPGMEDAQYISKMNASQAGIEATLGGHFQRPFIADELGEGTRLNLAELVYLLSGNKGTITATSSRRVAKNHEWQTIACSAGEISIADRIAEKGEIKGGQLDRAIDIPTTGSIFFDIGDASSESAFAGILKNACATYYGTAAEFFINWMIEHPDAFLRVQQKHFQDIESRLTPADCEDGAKRVVRFFANAVVTAFVAIESGLLPCTQEHVLNAFMEIVRRWWSYRKTTSPAQRLAMMLIENFNRIIHTVPPHDYLEDHIYFDEKNDRYCLDPSLFEVLIPGCTTSWIKSLVEQRLLVVDANNQGRLTKRYFYKGDKARRFTVINAKAISQELEQLVAQTLGRQTSTGENSGLSTIEDEED